MRATHVAEIEIHISPFPPPPPSPPPSFTPATTTTPQTNPTTASPTLRQKLDWIIHVWYLKIRLWFEAFAILVLVVPSHVAYLLGSLYLTGDNYLIPKKWLPDDETNDVQSGRRRHSPGGVYKKLQEFKTAKEKLQMWYITIMIRLGFLALLCGMILRVKFPDSSIRKWGLLVFIVFLGYPTLLLYINIVGVVFLSDFYSSKLKYFIDGLVDSFVWILHFVVILLIWWLYFCAQSDPNLSKGVEKIGICTIVSLLVGAVLWVLKSATLLEWKANAVHRRFKTRILTVGFHLYCLSIITEGSCKSKEHYWRGRNHPRIQDIISSFESDDLYLLETVAIRITKLARMTPRARKDGWVSDIIESYREKIPSQRDGGKVIKTEDLMELGFTDEDAKLLLEELKGDQMSEEINYDTLQKWMVDTHKNCLSFGYTLIDAFKVVSVLNRVIIGSLVVTAILVWLLITGIATTKVILLIASPFFATTFVFSDTIKTFFQGIIFSFVIHPYNVGDRCIIEGMELEVMLIGILTTTFARIGTREKMMYPNSSLSTKLITNLEGEPDPTDTIDLILHSTTKKSKILDLKEDLERFFESDDRHGSYEKTNNVSFREMGSSIKVSISFTHVMNVQDASHSQCLAKKKKQRSELIIHIKQFLEDRGIKLAAS